MSRSLFLTKKKIKERACSSNCKRWLYEKEKEEFTARAGNAKERGWFNGPLLSVYGTH
jgi:hypothetical protein